MSEGLLALGVDAGGTKTDAVVCDTAGAVHGFGTAAAATGSTTGSSRRLPRSPRPSTPRSPGRAHAPIRSPRRCSRSPGSTGRSTAKGSSPSWPASRSVARTCWSTTRSRRCAQAAAPSTARCRSPARDPSLRRATGRGETFRTMALGYGERGGGSDLVRRGARRDRAHAPRAGPADAARGALPRRARLRDDRRAVRGDLTPRPARCRRELAPLVLVAAADGDAAAAAIAQQMGESLAAAVVGVARILDMQDDVFEVVCAGGVHGAQQRDARRGVPRSARRRAARPRSPSR